MTRKIFTVLSAAAALISAAPAFAQDDVHTARVSYAGLDVASPEGARVFKAKLEGAVIAVCGDADLMNLRAFREMQTCRAKARAQADAGFQRVLAERSTSGAIQLASR